MRELSVQELKLQVISALLRLSSNPSVQDEVDALQKDILEKVVGQGG